MGMCPVVGVWVCMHKQAIPAAPLTQSPPRIYADTRMCLSACPFLSLSLCVCVCMCVTIPQARFIEATTEKAKVEAEAAACVERLGE